MSGSGQVLQLSDYLKFKFSAPSNSCKCGNCQLIPVAELKRFVDEHDALVKALREALAVIEDCVGYKHDGDPWTENAFDMGELDIHDYAKDGRLESARAALLKAGGSGDR